MSEHARDIELRAKLELEQLLAGGHPQRDLLGLITPAGGGLTLADLQELTTWTPYMIQDVLRGLFGRSVGDRGQSAGFGCTGERVYLFTHETLRHVAQQQFGNSLATYRDRLHSWADTWRDRRWPPDTPQYLLRSYPRMLISVADLTGGRDALAVAEINTAQQLILAQPDPDLTSLVPAVWAMLGQSTRAEGLAKGLPDPAKRASALTRLARLRWQAQALVRRRSAGRRA